MPVANDFRLNGALGGLVASQEYLGDQEKQDLANLLTQAQTQQTNQATDQASQLLPFLLQQREQENEIRAKEALAARLGMANVPQQIANQGLADQLAGKNTQFQLDQLPNTQNLAKLKMTGDTQTQEMNNQLGALRSISRVLQMQGPLAAAEAADKLGINPKVLLSDPGKLGEAIRHLENQVGWSPDYKKAMDTAGVTADTSITTTRMNNESNERIADTRAEAQREAAKIRQEAAAKAPGLEKEYVARKTAWENAGKPSEGPIAESYDKAHFDFFTNQNMRQPAQAVLQADGTIGYVTGTNRTIPDSGIKKKGSNSSAPKGSGESKLSPEQRQKIIETLKAK